MVSRPKTRRINTVLAILISGVGLIVGARPSAAEDFIATIYDVSDTKFSVEAISPREVIREYAICKAVWFAEKKHAQKLSLSDPVYDEPPKSIPPYPKQIPKGWIKLNTTAYLSDPSPSGNPMFSVGEKAAQCREYWTWYR